MFQRFAITTAAALALLTSGCALHVSDGPGGTDVSVTPWDGLKPSRDEVSGYPANFSGRYTGTCTQYLGYGSTSRHCGATVEITQTGSQVSLFLSYNSDKSTGSASSASYTISGNTLRDDWGFSKGKIGSRGLELYDTTFGEITIRSLGSRTISILAKTIPNQPYSAGVDYAFQATLQRGY